MLPAAMEMKSPEPFKIEMLRGCKKDWYCLAPSRSVCSLVSCWSYISGSPAGPKCVPLLRCNVESSSSRAHRVDKAWACDSSFRRLHASAAAPRKRNRACSPQSFKTASTMEAAWLCTAASGCKAAWNMRLKQSAHTGTSSAALPEPIGLSVHQDASDFCWRQSTTSLDCLMRYCGSHKHTFNRQSS